MVTEGPPTYVTPASNPAARAQEQRMPTSNAPPMLPPRKLPIFHILPTEGDAYKSEEPSERLPYLPLTLMPSCRLKPRNSFRAEQFLSQRRGITIPTTGAKRSRAGPMVYIEPDNDPLVPFLPEQSGGGEVKQLLVPRKSARINPFW